MNILNIQNPFNAPVYHSENVSSTMDISHQLALDNVPHGTVIAADFQEAGRGRIRNRIWEMEKGVNLPFTILLRYPKLEEIPAALTLRAGLAVSLAIEDFAPLLKNFVFVKWPNDIMINCKKAAGILCEVDGGYAQQTTSVERSFQAHLGIGINVAQKEFPDHLRKKATSIYKEQLTKNNGQKAISDNRFELLEMILTGLFRELETDLKESWKSRLEQRLYKKGERVTFIEGAADSGLIVKGCLAGIGDSGELLIVPDGEKDARSFYSGELILS